MNMAVLHISAPLVQAAAERVFEEGDDVEAKLRKCFEQCWDDNNCWMVAEDDLRMRVGIGALMLHYGTSSPEYSVIARSLKAIQALGAVLSGVPVDIASMFGDDDDQPKLIPLLPIYKEVKAVKEA